MPETGVSYGHHMSTVHAQRFVRDSVLRVESRLPHTFSCHGLTLEIAPGTRPERVVAELRAIRHDGRWTEGRASGPATIDVVRSGTELTELIVQLHDESRRPRRSEDRRRALLRELLDDIRRSMSRMPEASLVIDETPDVQPWRTPA